MSVTFAQDGPLAVVTIASPPLNLFDRTLVGQLHAAVQQVRASDARALLIRAEGKVVSGGVDVRRLSGLDAQQGEQLWSDWFETIHAVEDLPIPTVFAAHGLCLTAAFEVSLACDLLLATPEARFGLVEIVVGLTPSMGGPQRLAERAGPARARELVYTGGLYDAQTLERWNVVNQVLPSEGFAEATHAFAMTLAHGPTLAHAATKTIIRSQREIGARATDEIVPALSGALFDTEDVRAGVASFIQDGPGKATYLGR